MLRWTESLGVGVPKLDEDHKKLMTASNLLGEAAAMGNFALAASLAENLHAMMGKHFRQEVSVLQKYRYPSVNAFIASSKHLLDRLENISECIKNQLVEEVTKALADFESRSLAFIIRNDLDYKWFFLDRGIKPVIEEEMADDATCCDRA